MDLYDPYPFQRYLSFPRTRGDGPPPTGRCIPAGLFPPHTRGWTVGTGQEGRRREVSPAHAGMDLELVGRHVQFFRFPRTRGDGPYPVDRIAGASMFPPHTRGWTFIKGGVRQPCPVSPAHAGMDPRSTSGGARTRSFPRTRGDGPRRRTWMQLWRRPSFRGLLYSYKRDACEAQLLTWFSSRMFASLRRFQRELVTLLSMRPAWTLWLLVSLTWVSIAVPELSEPLPRRRQRRFSFLLTLCDARRTRPRIDQEL